MPIPRKPSPAEQIIREVYDQLENRPVERSCVQQTECCRFQSSGKTPYVTKGEALVAARAWRATGRKSISIPEDGVCPFLSRKTGRCQIYESRPLPCRTHFCQAAGGPYQRKDVQDLIWVLERVDHELQGEGARPIAEAVQQWLGG